MTLVSAVVPPRSTGVLILYITKQVTTYKYYQEKMLILSQNSLVDAVTVHIYDKVADWGWLETATAHTQKVWAFRGMSNKQQTITKNLQNLYSWTQFYQERGNKNQIRKCQTQIAELKKAYNQTKTKKNG